MMNRRSNRLRAFCAAAAALLGAQAIVHVANAGYIETPVLEKRVADGKLPPVAQRLPETPRLIDISGDGRGPGQHGGTMRLLMGDQRDIRMITIYGYTRLVVFNEKLELVPDLIEKFDVEEGRVFTLHLRKGHKWSDGSPFTSEDFRYFWEDVANNDKLSPGGPPATMLPGGKKPRVEIVDAQTVRYSWDAPNPSFIPALAGAQPLYIYLPAAYMKQFHPRYADPTKLAAAIKAMKVKDWGSLHERKSRMYRPENPDLPSLDPWVNRTAPPAELFAFERNPYFHRVDANGRQLPYVDAIRMATGTSALIPAKVGSGESDLQARYLRFDNYTFLKDCESRNNYRVRLWQRAEGAYVTMLPNQNVIDPVWRPIVRDVRFRRAVSLAINRKDINQVIFYGLAKETADTVMPQSPLYKPEYQKAWVQYDPAAANRMLDEMGLTKRALDGIRLLPDGRRAEIIVEASGESTEESDILELVAEDLRKVGIRILTHTSSRDIFRRRVMAGQTIMSVWSGLDNAMPSSEMEPEALAPANQAQLQWPLWGLNTVSNGASGEASDDPRVMDLIALLRKWRQSSTPEERREIWTRMLEIHADQVYSIGIVGATAQPVVVNNKLRNVPERGFYSFEPGAFFGMYMPDTFWFAEPVAAR